MRFCLLFLLLNFTSIAIYAQDSLAVQQEVKYDEQANVKPVHFEDGKIAEYKESSDFNYLEKNTELSWWQKFKNWLNNLWRSFIDWLVGDYSPGSFVAFLVQAGPYIIIGAILGFIIWLFIRLNPAMSFTKKGENPDVILSEEEKIITQQDIPLLIKEALQQQNYRLAVRYYYLLILKMLKDQQVIDYQFQKTNHEYLDEIEAADLRENFDQITRIYDFIWYGNFPVNNEDYLLAEKAFESMQEELKQLPDE